MGIEPFLINPLPRKIKRIPRFKLKRYRKAVRKRLAASELIRRRLRDNPLGGEVMILGLNPVSRRSRKRRLKRKLKTIRRFSLMNPRRRRRRKATHNARRRRSMRLHDNPRHRRRRAKHNARRRRSYRMHDNPRRRRARRHDNPRRRRSLRHNPALSLSSVKHILPLAVTGGASIIVTNIAPGIVGIQNQWARYGTQAAVALVGGVAVDKVVGREHGLVWAVSGVAVVVADLLQKYVLSRVLPVAAPAVAGFDGMGYLNDGAGYMDAFPGMSAYPEMSGFDAYPYAGVAPSY